MLFSNDSLDNTTQEDKLLLVEICDLLDRAYRKAQKIKYEGKRPSYECHSICRALSLVLKNKVQYVDGLYVSLKKYNDPKEYAVCRCDHTWLVTPSGSIINPYPVAMMTFSPLLFVNGGIYKNFVEAIYNPDPSVTKEKGNRETWRKAFILAKLFKTT